MTFIGSFGLPGQGAASTTVENEFLWGGDASRIEVLQVGVSVAGAARDAGATPTSTLRKGLIMGRVTSSGEEMQYDPTATDGTQLPTGILPVELRMLDIDGNNVGRFPPLIVKAPIKAANVYIKGTALTAHADQYLARRQLAALGFRFDDDPAGKHSGNNYRIVTKATNYTVLASDNNTLFQQKTADAIFTLPAIASGLKFKFQQTADFEMVVASAEGDNMVVGNDLSADSITFTTAGQQIGALVEIEGMYVDGTLKWVVTLPYVPFGTGLATLAFAIAT